MNKELIKLVSAVGDLRIVKEHVTFLVWYIAYGRAVTELTFSLGVG